MTSFNEGSIHNQFACHVLVHIINIKPSSTAQSWISPGLSTHAVNPTLSPLSQSLTHLLSVSLLSPFSLTVPVCVALISDPWHVNNFSGILQKWKEPATEMVFCPALTFPFGQNMAVDALAKLEMLEYGLVICLCFGFKHLTFNENLFCLFACRPFFGWIDFDGFLCFSWGFLGPPA